MRAIIKITFYIIVQMVRAGPVERWDWKYCTHSNARGVDIDKSGKMNAIQIPKSNKMLEMTSKTTCYQRNHRQPNGSRVRDTEKKERKRTVCPLNKSKRNTLTREKKQVHTIRCHLKRSIGMHSAACKQLFTLHREIERKKPFGNLNATDERKNKHCRNASGDENGG